MLISDRTMDFTAVSGFVQTFLATQEETNGRYVELEIVLQPGAGGAPRHVHPQQEERFEVKEGDRWTTSSLHSSEDAWDIRSIDAARS